MASILLSVNEAETGCHTLKVVWEPTDLPEIAYYQVFKNGDFSFTVDAATLEKEFINLVHNTSYNFYVEGYNGDNELLATSNTDSAFTNDCVLSPVMPVLSTDGIGTNSIKITLTEAENLPAVYNYLVYKDGSYQGTIPYNNPSNNYPREWEFTGLTAETEYTFKIVVENIGEGVLGESNTLTVTTLGEITPPVLVLDSQVGAILTFSGSEASGEVIDDYYLQKDGINIEPFDFEEGFNSSFAPGFHVFRIVGFIDGYPVTLSNEIEVIIEEEEEEEECIVALEQEIFIPFKFYDDIRKQNRYKRHCRGAAVYELITPSNKFLPFFIKRTDNNSFPTSIKIFDLDGNIVQDITSGMTYELLTDGTYAYFFYYGTIISEMSLDCGFYYIVVEFCESEKYYSEVFAPKPFTTDDEEQPYILLEWKHSKNVSDLIYQTGYVNRLYIDSFLAEPTYELEQEGDENGERDFIPSFQRGVKTYRIEVTPVPEYITDALFLLNAHDNKKIIADNYTITNFKDAVFETKWIDTGCLATGILSFRKYPAIISRNCGDNLELEAVSLPINCGDYQGFTLQQLIDSGVTLGQILDCTLNDFLP